MDAAMCWTCMRATGLSGGQKQKLVIFCLAAALRYQLADEGQPVPTYGTVVLDEAFGRADHRFTATAMDIFEPFGFHMILATPMKLLQTAEHHIGAIAYVHCQDRKQSTMRLIEIEKTMDLWLTKRWRGGRWLRLRG